MQPFLCSRCEHWCHEGIKFTRRGRILFHCSTCHHETTLVRVPADSIPEE